MSEGAGNSSIARLVGAGMRSFDFLFVFITVIAVIAVVFLVGIFVVAAVFVTAIFAAAVLCFLVVLIVLIVFHDILLLIKNELQTLMKKCVYFALVIDARPRKVSANPRSLVPPYKGDKLSKPRWQRA